MLRRVTPDSVCVFVALSKAARVTLTVHREEPAGSENYVQIGSVTNDTVSLGVNLHVLAATAPVATAHQLVSGEIYSYNLAFDLGAGSPTTLVRDQFLSPGNAIGYGGRLPSFAMPPSLSKLKLVHGSCRKSGGEGKDMLPLLDIFIKQNHLDPFERPHQLLLTGDQIYADDVPACLFTTLRETAAQLLGWPSPETIKWDGGVLLADDPRLRPGHAREDYEKRHQPCEPSTVASRQAGSGFLTRFEFMFSQTDFSSLEADAHLMFLGEYYAQYLMAWSPELWPRSADPNPMDPLDGALDRRDNPQPYDLATIDETFPDLLSSDRAYYTAQVAYRTRARETRRQARRFAKSLPEVRRALANVPTYMILDDHEVTDDWNVHRSWHDSVLANTSGKHIVRNGLIAYAVFQDWGNQPEHYGAGAGRELLNKIETTAASPVPTIVTEPEALDTVLRLHAASVPADPATVLTWDHVAYGTAHQVLFMDTRTWREFPDGPDAKAPAFLMGPASLDRQFSGPRVRPNLLTLVVSPGPVIGINRVEAIQAVAVAVEGPEFGDRETWEGQQTALAALMQRVVELAPAVFLSGDVHYAFVKEVAISRVNAPSLVKGRVAQLNCSALRNEERKTRLLGGKLTPSVLHSMLCEVLPADPKELGRRVEQHFEAAATAASANPAADQEYIDGLYRTLAAIRLNNTLGLPVTIDEVTGPEYEEAKLLMMQHVPASANPWAYNVEGIDELDGLSVHDAATLEEKSLKSFYFRRLSSSHRRSPYVIGKNNIAQVTFNPLTAGATTPGEVVQTLYFHDSVPLYEDDLVRYVAAASLRPY